MVPLYALLLGLVCGGPSAPAPTTHVEIDIIAPSAAAASTAPTVRVRTVHAQPKHTHLVDPFSRPNPRVALASHSGELVDPFALSPRTRRRTPGQVRGSQLQDPFAS